MVAGSSGAQLEGPLVRADVGQAALLQVRRRQKGLVPARDDPAEGLRDSLSLPGIRKSTGQFKL